jgi:hypothetical protein
MAIQRPHTRTNLPYCSALRLYTYWRSGAVFHAPGIPESRFPASRSWDCPQVSFLGIPWNSGQKSNDDIIEFPAAAGNGQRFKAVAICIPRAFTHYARQRLHTHCVHGSGSALACPGVAPLAQVRSSPARSCRAARHRPAAYRRLFLHVRAGGGHAGAAASRSTVSGQPGAHRTSTRPKHNHPAAVKSLLNKWFHANYDHPFPDGRTKAELAARTGERLLPSCGASW